jgi:hypothetical protein
VERSLLYLGDMQRRHLLAALVLSTTIGCADDPQSAGSADVGITYRTVQADRVEGVFKTAYGEVDFTSVVVAEGVIDVSFTRAETTFGSHVDWNVLKNDLRYQPGFAITEDDRFLMKALASALENDIGNTMTSSDNLIRQANLWGHHPEGVVTMTEVVGDPERGWTRLCGVGHSTFKHDASSHGLQSEYLACGPSEKSNPCRDRCGPGCTSWGSSAWTTDCGEHDRCEQLHSHGSCTDEFGAASDDFSFARNC